ncbi:3-oxoacyl-[acyl-carrier-protein] reductase FabG-like [Telopea speciosissima]|uniref:3-oxoacyl-[acyl-carrier-protein] reductase FabG-like n=1 Tax=Telopea speciosissima TaxID=54955 RepID=UPI001CC3B464|nr:3-oxoacyl-[acyl-carrier-protein] reductase FabG-like [Telopea speciosissima]
MTDNGGARNLELWNRLEGKVVMVTGASSGLGREFCLNLAMAGCNILAVARRKDRLKSLCDEINQMKLKNSNINASASASSSSSEDSKSKAFAEIRAVAVELDVCSAGPAIDASVHIAWDAFGRIDALINSAGVRGTVSSSLDLSEEEWNNTIRTDLTGSWLVTKSVCRRFRENGLEGSVIFISSISGTQRGELPGGIAYGAAKAGLNAMTKIMAIELGQLKIRVNSIAPGLFKSEITEGLMQKDWLDTVALKTIPLGKFGTIDPALTSLIRYLIHDSSSYVSGNVFIVDSGNTLPGVPIFSSL